MGAFELQHREAIVDEFGDRLDEQLLAYVALNAPTAVSREVIAGNLWADADTVTARKNLSFNLFQLKKRLAEHQLQEPIQDVRHSLRLSSSITVDALGFTHALAASTATSSATERVLLLDRAISMYGAGLLPGVSVAWLTPHQQQFTRLYQDAVRALAALTHRDGPLRSLMEHVPSTAWHAGSPERPPREQVVDDLPRAAAGATDALAHFTALKDPAGIALCQQLLCRLAYRRGEFPEAIGLMRAGVETAREIGDNWELGTALGYLAICLEAAGETFEATSTMRHAATLLRSCDDAGAIDRFEAELAQIRAERG